MTDHFTPDPAARAFDVEYNFYPNPVYNLDLGGRGRLKIAADGSRFRFTGRSRGWFARRQVELVFRPADIANVAVHDRTVQFKTRLGRSGEQQRPFAFHLRDAAEAQAVAALLPLNFEAETDGHRDFAVQLQDVAGPSTPWTSPTTIIIALNIAMFLFMGSRGAGWFETASMQPYVEFAANNGAATTGGEWWRLLTSMFVHYGLLHLGFNMWALSQAGHFIEKVLGRLPFLLMYLASGLAGGFASIAWHGDKIWSAGASGAVFGVYGAILGYSLRYRHALPRGVYQSMRNSTLTFAGYNIAFGFAVPGIDNAAHGGGFAGGILFGFLLALPLDRGARARGGRQRLAAGIAALALLVAAGVGFSPRYDYRVRDELAWESGLRGFVPTERKLLDENQRRIRQLKTEGSAAYVEWLEKELIPFYVDWVRKLDRLPLDATKVTARTRTSLVGVLNHRVATYRRLVSDLRANDPEAFARFEAEDALVVEESERVPQRSRP